MRHAKWEINTEMRDHWMNAMLVALDQLLVEPTIRETMVDYFSKAANHMINHA
jgi:hemoglobin